MKYLVTIILLTLIVSCVVQTDMPDDIEIANAKWSAEKSPHRAKYVKLEDGAAALSMEWAGIPGDSYVKNADPQLSSDIFNALQVRCGYKRADFVETRIVEHKHPEYYEVWIFRHEESIRKDKLSGISVVIKVLPNGGGTDVNYYGDCHSE